MPRPAPKYVVGWRCAGLVLMGSGWLAAPLVFGPLAVIGLCALGVFVSLLIFVFLDTNAWWASRRRPAPSIAPAIVAAGVTVASVVAIEALGAIGWWLLAAVILTSPSVVSVLPGLRTNAAPAAVGEAASLSTSALVREWRASCSLLARARTATAKAAVAALRREYLDELERRDPEGVRRWLASGARAIGDPSPYLTRPSDTRG